MKNRLNRFIPFTLLTILILFAPQLWASGSGAAGPSFEDCSTCHTSGSAAVEFTNGTSIDVVAGSTTELTLHLTGSLETTDVGGFRISASDGVISHDMGAAAKIENGILTHADSPFNIETSEIHWHFNWQAPAQAGTYTVTGKAVLGNGDGSLTGDTYGLATLTVNVEAAPAAQLLVPTAVLDSAYTGQPAAAITFDASSSSDDGEIVRYLWDFGDGTAIVNSGGSATVDHTYSNEGSYIVTMAVTDDDGLTDVVAADVIVGANAEGAQIYINNCQGCHGAEGEINVGGNTPIADQNLNSTDLENAFQISPMTTYGPGGANELSSQAIQALVDYINTFPAPPVATTGEGLYNQNCSGCHGSAGSGASAPAIAQASRAQVDAALTRAPMDSFGLSSEEVGLIVDYLGTVEEPPRPTTGPGLYAQFCAGCHGEDGLGGSAKGVTGSSYAFIQDAINRIQAMQNIDLSVEETQKVATYLQQGGGATLPDDDDGEGLYGRFCAVCHGDLSNGADNVSSATYKLVTGAPPGMINSAINGGQPMMEGLPLSSVQINSIGQYLSEGGSNPDQLPAEGDTLYGVFCAVCHGDGGHGGKFKPVTGANSQYIDDAINSAQFHITAMEYLVITDQQRDLIADFLGDGGQQFLDGTLPTDGEGLYGVYCSVCHGADGLGGGHSDTGEDRFKGVTGSPDSFIQNAIDSRIAMMSHLDILSSSNVTSIASFLLQGGSAPEPTTGDGLYGMYCSVCHGDNGLGSTFKVVTGSSLSFINNALNDISLMQPLDQQAPLSSQELEQIATFLASGGSDPKPTDGAGLYYTFCETCHGPNGSGGSVGENVSGASGDEVYNAVNGEGDMLHLRNYINQTDADRIGSFLGGN